MGKDPTSLPDDCSEWPTFLSGGRLGSGGGGCAGVARPCSCATVRIGGAGYPAQYQQQGVGAAMVYSLQLILLCALTLLVRMVVGRGCMIMQFVQVVGG